MLQALCAARAVVLEDIDSIALGVVLGPDCTDFVWWSILWLVFGKPNIFQAKVIDMEEPKRHSLVSLHPSGLSSYGSPI